MPRKISFQIVSASTADEQHPASELNHHGPLVNGWQSNRFCSYPQELIVQFEHVARIRRVQLLSHQFLIGKDASLLLSISISIGAPFLASKIEFFIGDCTSDDSITVENAHYTRLG